MKRGVILAVLMVLSAYAEAASYYIKPRLETQVRKTSSDKREIPFSSYLDSGLSDLPHSGTFDVSLKNERIFKQEQDEFDLYQAVFRMQDLGGLLGVSGGRQFISPGFHAYLMDGASLSLGKESWPVTVGLFGGIPRYIETGDFHGEAGLVSGMTLDMSMNEHMHTRFSAVYDKLDINEKNWSENETVLVGMSHSHQFGSKLSPSLYGTMEYDTAGKTVETGLMGFSLQPLARLYWNLEGGHYNTNRDRARSTIFGLYTTGPFYQARTGANLTLIEDAGAVADFALTGGYSYQRLEISSSASKNGNIADAGFKFTIVPLHLDAGVTYRFYDSFGGRAHDVIVSLHDEPFDKAALDAGADFTKYSKITNDNDTATSVFLMAGYELLKNLEISAGGEYLRNNIFSSEWRATAKLGYKLEGKI
ncbi:MAG: hypothetical protein HYT75_01350 [Deltaproteobacteria bacterium]|nr:hypothetical protein [Deltaproteobacteria bacterium]